MSTQTLYFLGYASSIAAPKTGSADGPQVLHDSSYLSALQNEGMTLHWNEILKPQQNPASKLEAVFEISQALAQHVNQFTREKKFFVVVGGDHSSAIGTWSGAAHALSAKGPLGLIWIDAHMDSHTPETSDTGNIHGMPVASLLGFGATELTTLLDKNPKLDPQYLCLIGVRSFEPDEAALLKRLNVKIYYMDEVNRRGLNVVMHEAIEMVSRKTAGFGVTIDIDSMDPKDAPGTGVVEEGGIAAKDLCQGLTLLAHHPKLIGLEIAEFDPHLDVNQMTEKLIPQMIRALISGKFKL